MAEARAQGAFPLDEAPPRVLVVEDDATLRDVLSLVLSEEGFSVELAPDGRAGLECMRRNRPDIVLLDLMMPEMNGWQFRLAQRAEPHLAEVPIIAFSADASEQAAVIDAELFLPKPVSVGRLVTGLRETLRTARLRRLAEQDRMASLGTLLSGIAHEINNPLTAVLANVQILREQTPLLRGDAAGRDALVDDCAEMLGEIEGGAIRIRDIVRQIRVFSHAADERREEVDVLQVARESAALFEAKLRGHARLELDLRPVPPILGSAAQLGQVLVNLLLNAQQALTVSDPATQAVRVCVRPEGNGLVVIEVSDTGCGVPAAIRGRIFEPFFTTRPIGKGAGLGLSVCHAIVGKLGGRIELESTEGGGSTFRVRLPATTPRGRPFASAV